MFVVLWNQKTSSLKKLGTGKTFGIAALSPIRLNSAAPGKAFRMTTAKLLISLLGAGMHW